MPGAYLRPWKKIPTRQSSAGTHQGRWTTSGTLAGRHPIQDDPLYVAPYITAPICQGMNSSSPKPSDSDLV